VSKGFTDGLGLFSISSAETGTSLCLLKLNLPDLYNLKVSCLTQGIRQGKLQNPQYKSKVNVTYEGWNFNSGNYLFTTDTK